jgi:hypothetical protein
MMSPTTTAKDVMDALETQGQLANWAGIDGWMLFEVSQDFGMGWWPFSFDRVILLTQQLIVERPIRLFETVSEVINSWDKNKMVNLLVAKKTPLATLLHPSVRLIRRLSFIAIVSKIYCFLDRPCHPVRLCLVPMLSGRANHGNGPKDGLNCESKVFGSPKRTM